MDFDFVENTDCIKFMREELPDESIDIIVTDPPYLMNYKTGRRKDKEHKFCTTIAGDNDSELIANYCKECYRVLKNDTAIYMFCNVNHVEVFKRELERAGFNIKNMIIWVKNNHTAGDLVAQYGKRYEIIFYANKGRCPIRGGRVDDVWEFKKVAGKTQVHQNQKPIDLLTQCIEKSSDEGAIVFDGFMGSGSTAIASAKCGRHYIGCELDPEYYNIMCNRLDEEGV